MSRNDQANRLIRLPFRDSKFELSVLLSEPGDRLREDGPGCSCEAGDLQVAVALPVESLSAFSTRQDGKVVVKRARASVVRPVVRSAADRRRVEFAIAGTPLMASGGNFGAGD
jgi:hypothetical protein